MKRKLPSTRLMSCLSSKKRNSGTCWTRWTANRLPPLSQAQRLKKYSQEGHLTLDMMRVIMGEEKKSDLDKVTFTSDTLRKYFPKSYTPQRMQETIIKLLEAWQKKRQRDQER